MQFMHVLKMNLKMENRMIKCKLIVNRFLFSDWLSVNGFFRCDYFRSHYSNYLFQGWENDIGSSIQRNPNIKQNPQTKNFYLTVINRPSSTFKGSLATEPCNSDLWFLGQFACGG